jgi:predicted RNase H-like HicB family nuclease
MVNEISIIISKNPDGYSVKFPELELINHQDSSLENVLNRLKTVLETHLISSDIFPEEKLSQLPFEGKEIIKFAGIWEDIPEEDFINFCEEVEQRRQNSLSRRFEI